MGIYEKPGQQFLNNIAANFNFQPPQHHGYDVVEAIKAMHGGKASLFIAMGGNFSIGHTRHQLHCHGLKQMCTLTVHVSTKLNRSHLVHGQEALILPCLGRSDKDIVNGEEQIVSCENSMGLFNYRKAYCNRLVTYC